MHSFFIATTKKKEGALHTDRPVFEFPNHPAEFPNQPTCMIFLPALKHFLQTVDLIRHFCKYWQNELHEFAIISARPGPDSAILGLLYSKQTVMAMQ